MAGWLRKQRDDEDERIRRADLGELLPASVFRPETARLTPLGSDMPDDAPDVDLEFLSGLAQEVDAERARLGNEAAAGASTAGERSDEALQFFRDMSNERDQDVVRRYNFHLADVEIADLLEDLSTTAAALRARRAA